ncbi:MAG: DUF2956 family protein [Aeromonadaceae bacterium]
MNRKPEISDEVVAESLRLARANQVPGQTKEQTQLIAQGIQKGLAEYKRAQKARQREADKARKKQRKSPNSLESGVDVVVENESRMGGEARPWLLWLPWILLLLSWLGMALSLLLTSDSCQ